MLQGASCLESDELNRLVKGLMMKYRSAEGEVPMYVRGKVNIKGECGSSWINENCVHCSINTGAYFERWFFSRDSIYLRPNRELNFRLCAHINRSAVQKTREKPTPGSKVCAKGLKYVAISFH